MPTLIMMAVPEREAGAAVGLNGLMRSIGTTLASAVMVAILTSTTTELGGFAIPTEGAFRACFLVAALAAVLGAAIAAAIPSPRPARG
jgi:sugar phosphate permease